MKQGLKLLTIFLSLAMAVFVTPRFTLADNCVTNDDCKPGQLCNAVEVCGDSACSFFTWTKVCQGTPWPSQNTCFGCNATGAYCSTYETTPSVGCGPGYDYNNSNCNSCGGGGGGGCTEINFSPTPPFDVYITANGAQVKITHLSHSTGNDNFGRPLVAPFPMYYDWNNIYHPPGEPKVTDYSAAYTQCQAGTNLDSQNNWGSSSGNTLTLQTTITRHTENWGSSNTSQYEDQSGWQLDIQNSGYHFNSCTGPTSVGPVWDVTSSFEKAPIYGTSQSYTVYGPDDCNSQTNLYIKPSSGTSASDQNGTVSPSTGASTTTSTPVKVVATSTTLCSTGITNPPTSAGGLTGCVAVSPFSCSSGNPDDTLSCWGQWSCNASSTTGTYPIGFTSAANPSCASGVPLNVVLPPPATVTTTVNPCTSEGKGSITVNWTPVSGATGYVTYRDGVKLADIPASQTNWTDDVTSDPNNPPKPGITYNYQVQAMASGNPGTISTPSPATIPVTEAGCDVNPPAISSVTSLSGCQTPTNSVFSTGIQITATDTGSGVASEKAYFESPTGFDTSSPPASWGPDLVFKPSVINPSPQAGLSYTGTIPISYSDFTVDKLYYLTASATDMTGKVGYYPVANAALPNAFWVNPLCPSPYFQTFNGDVHANSNQGGGIKVGQ